MPYPIGRAKRALDIVLGSILAVLTFPLMVVMAIGVGISLRARPFFQHTRPGHLGQPLLVIKLRTMPMSTPVHADKHSDAITSLQLPWFCRILRQTHLDELPQLWSVVLGHMSLVGPRPRLADSAEAIDPTFDAVRTSVRPGCTGLWQISSEADGNATSAPELDVFYIENASLRIDLWIIARTVGMILHLTQPVTLQDVPGAFTDADRDATGEIATGEIDWVMPEQGAPTFALHLPRQDHVAAPASDSRQSISSSFASSA